MKEREPFFIENYNEHKKWVREFAEENGIETDEGAEHFVVPYETEEGKSHRIYIRAWKKIPLGDKDGKIIEQIPVKTAIEAVKKYPGISFPEAIKKFRHGL